MEKKNGNGKGGIKHAQVKFVDISTGQFSGEVIVTFCGVKGNITCIFPKSFINEKNKTINVSLVDEKDELFLVDLPTYTFTTGSRVWLSKDVIQLEGSMA
jgi:hypothetical protein